MTTSNPVVPRIDAAASILGHSNSALGTRPRETYFTLWPLADFLCIALTLASLMYLLSPVALGTWRISAGRYLTLPLVLPAVYVFLFWVVGIYSLPSTPLNVSETEQLLRATTFIAAVGTVMAAYLDLDLGFTVFMTS